MNLLPQHAADLRASGLTDETIAAAGIRSESDPDVIRKLLNWKGGAAKLGPCMVIPHFGPNGAPTGYHILKPERPLTDNKGRVRKYECVKGRETEAYFPPGTRAALADPTIPLLVTEGAKKALATDQVGLACVALAGVFGFQQKRPKGTDGKATGPRKLIESLTPVVWKGRTVTIIYDSDATTNKNVLWAEWHLSQVLRAQDARVNVVRLPAGANGAKQGLDDFIVVNGADALKALIAGAKPPVRPNSDEPNDDPANPHRLAAGFLASRPIDQPIRFHRGEFLRYSEGAYREIPDTDMRGELTCWVREEFVRQNAKAVTEWEAIADEKKGKKPTVRPVTVRLLSDVLQALRGVSLLSASTHSPAWINGATGSNPAGLLPVKNGLLDLAAAAAGRPDCLSPNTPNFFTATAAPFDYDPTAPEPKEWLKLLHEIWDADQESIDALCEWFAYLLSLDTRLQKILLIVGPKRSGKGTIARVLRALIGFLNFAGPTLGSLSTNFGLSPLLGKSVAVVSDARLSGRTDSSIVTERLLSISGEDCITVDRKHRDPVTIKLPTRLVIMTNELPKLGDSSGALAGRFIILRMTRSWFGKEDAGLFDRLEKELPGILLWALKGWSRLTARGRFFQPASGAVLVESMEDIASPVNMFVKEKCRLAPGLQVEKSELYSAWRQWCDAKGRKEPGTEPMFARDLRAAFSGLGDARPRAGGGRINVYIGIGMRPFGDLSEEEEVNGHPDHPDQRESGQGGHPDQALHACGVKNRSEDTYRATVSGHPDHPDHPDQADLLSDIPGFLGGERGRL
ncbi:hypothetical protein VT84_05095 [Gemmata sp. SH-PL17]|uniref:phage/plasmid primase, P4 family n=1 Tax=Gemmata sp. SH-PL17 TaxID=1630693 RepID=UPI00078B34F6|nr:phage/plasmid primase, P4 family [Gemmata sp. SH-PL17]AMV23766.1 hypothetical protein VT84_05095 [Gemmata sp. SH-PL17]